MANPVTNGYHSFCYSPVAVCAGTHKPGLLIRTGAAMGHYKSNLRDIEFNLFEMLRRQDLLGREPYPDSTRRPPAASSTR